MLKDSSLCKIMTVATNSKRNSTKRNNLIDKTSKRERKTVQRMRGRIRRKTRKKSRIRELD